MYTNFTRQYSDVIYKKERVQAEQQLRHAGTMVSIKIVKIPNLC